MTTRLTQTVFGNHPSWNHLLCRKCNKNIDWRPRWERDAKKINEMPREQFKLTSVTVIVHTPFWLRPCKNQPNHTKQFPRCVDPKFGKPAKRGWVHRTNDETSKCSRMPAKIRLEKRWTNVCNQSSGDSARKTICEMKLATTDNTWAP